MIHTYFDYAAATPLDARVQAAMAPFYSDQFYNPSAQYKAAAEVRQATQAARAKVGAVLGARPTEIIFTGGGTEANNLAIRGIMERFPDGNIIVSAIEHDSILEPAATYECRIAPVLPDGRIDLAALEKLIDDKTVLVSIMYANNEIGTVQPLSEIAALIQKIRTGRTTQKGRTQYSDTVTSDSKPSGSKTRPLYFHTDACQAANYLTLQASRLGVDLITLNAGKMYGPKQCGVLYVRHGTELAPLIRGGGQERGLRSGTENVAGQIGLAAALEITHAMRESESARLQELRDTLVSLLEAKVPGLIVNGSRTHRLPNNVHVTIPGQDNERLLFALDELGYQVAAGSACSAGSEEPSHVLKALGISDESAQSSLRITLGRHSAEAGVMGLAEAIANFTR